MKVTLSTPRPDGSGADDWQEVELDQIPDAGEFLMVDKRGFQVVQRSWRLDQVRTEDGPIWEQGCGLLLQQVMGPPIIKAPTLDEVKGLRLQS